MRTELLSLVAALRRDGPLTSTSRPGSTLRTRTTRSGKSNVSIVRNRLQAEYDRLGFWRIFVVALADGILFGLLIRVFVFDGLGIVTLPHFPILLIYYLGVGFVIWLLTAGRCPRRRSS